MELEPANPQRNSACICTCGCNRVVSYPTRRAHVAAKRAIAGEAEHAIDQPQPLRDTNVVAGRKRRRLTFFGDYYEEEQIDGSDFPPYRDDEPPQANDVNSPPFHDQEAGLRSIHVDTRNQETIAQRWSSSSRPIPGSSQREEEGLDDDEAEDSEDSSEDWEDNNDLNDGIGEHEDRSEEGAEEEDQSERNEDENEDDSQDGANENEDSEDVSAPCTDIVSISFWDRISDELAYKLMTTGLSLDSSDLSMLRQYALKVEDHLTESTFVKFKFAFPESHHHTLRITKRHIELLSEFHSIRYSCCINSCVCFTGLYNDLTQCPNCKEDRFNDRGQPRKVFDYLPLIPRLQAMSANHQHATKMRYRAHFVHQPGVTTDVFDGSHYQSLLSKLVPGSNNNNPFYHFSDERDIALGLSTDGFAPFKQRNKTCWPIILFNYNLPPDIRFQKQYHLNVGTIPGPKKPWDMDSFLWPLIQELIQLEIGVKAFDAVSKSVFLLHAYLILVFGDIPAIALVMRMKGANGCSPCRVCKIAGVRGTNSKTYYVPLRRDQVPHSNPPRYDPSRLPLRIHNELMDQAREVQSAPNQTISNQLAKQYGIKGIPILSTLSAVSFPESFPFDFMHLIWENLIPNLILFWTASFKDLDHRDQGYTIPPEAWKEIGASTASCKVTIPAAFGAPVPNIALLQSQMTSEMYSNWTLFIAPIVLRGRFCQPKYYQHFMKLVGLLKMCLEFEISGEMLDVIDQGFQAWVEDYEKFYYAHHLNRLSACPLTVHALLHIAWGIRVAGPVWAYWAFPMERHCNSLLPSIRSRRHPYASISAFVVAMVQLNQIRLKYNLFSELNLNVVKQGLLKNEFIPHSYPSFKLSPPRRQQPLSAYLRDKLQAALATRFEEEKTTIQALIDLDGPITCYGRVTLLDGGDTIVGRDMVRQCEDSRDASYIKYIQMVDKYAHQPRREPVYTKRFFFGQLKQILVLKLPSIPQLALDSPSAIVYAVVQSVKVTLTNNLYSYRDMGAIQVIDLNTIQSGMSTAHDE
ncbi:hypothetical protein Agabi119p4_5690 [Agaricus bisporus var. burnettii]|uniref:Transposase domain-containing protein n=1 Tax=Agaricus bisporus var. burnettii TaxID=192524 RepID=A0A8H7F241_AGABI|nr:hypothetical protein Agabi119p4_5690 [Agaricus bisporus var. burnettii]